MTRMKELIEKLLFEIKEPFPIFLWGVPGGGKSSMIEDIAERRGEKPSKHHFYDAIDTRGVPRVEKGVNREDIVKWALPRWLPREGTGILLLYDFNLCMDGMQQTLIDFFATRRLERENERTEMAKDWRIVCTGIIPYEGNDVLPLHSHLVPLFLHLGYGSKAPDFENDYVLDVSSPSEKEAFRSGLHPEVKGFLLQEPEYECKGRAILRTWNYLSTCLRDIALEREELTMVAEGLVGEQAAAKFLAFVDNGAQEGV